MISLCISPPWYRCLIGLSIWESEKNFEEQVQRISAQTVGEICTKPAISCTPETPVSEIADLMVTKKIHLIPVVNGEQLVGVVARLDIVKSLGA